MPWTTSTNWSPPMRAAAGSVEPAVPTPSPIRIVPLSLSPISRSNSSPTSEPSVTLTRSNRSQSMNITANR